MCSYIARLNGSSPSLAGPASLKAHRSDCQSGHVGLFLQTGCPSWRPTKSHFSSDYKCTYSIAPTPVFF